MDIPSISIRRLCQIYRLIEQLEKAGRKNIFSDEIGECTGVPSYQIRRDISYLGEIGTPGRGYDVGRLKQHIGNALNLTKKTKAVCVGVGRLGSALLNYINLPKSSYTFIAGFDTDPGKIDTQENGIPVYSMDKLTEVAEVNDVETGVIAVPAAEAQNAADLLVGAGVTGILNFAPVWIDIPDHVVKCNIDFSIEMNYLTAIKAVSALKLS